MLNILHFTSFFPLKTPWVPHAYWCQITFQSDLVILFSDTVSFFQLFSPCLLSLPDCRVKHVVDDHKALVILLKRSQFRDDLHQTAAKHKQPSLCSALAGVNISNTIGSRSLTAARRLTLTVWDAMKRGPWRGYGGEEGDYALRQLLVGMRLF